MCDAITIIIPGTPDKLLTVNAARRTHYLTKADISRQARHNARYATISVLGILSQPIFSGPVWVTETIAWGKGERSTDLDSIASMCKPILDGITDSGSVWIDDRQITELTVRQRRDPAKIGFVEVLIRAAEGSSQ